MYSEELAQIRDAASAAGESVAEYVRKRIIEPMERITETAKESEQTVLRPLELEERHSFPKPSSSAKKRVKR